MTVSSRDSRCPDAPAKGGLGPFGTCHQSIAQDRGHGHVLGHFPPWQDVHAPAMPQGPHRRGVEHILARFGEPGPGRDLIGGLVVAPPHGLVLGEQQRFDAALVGRSYHPLDAGRPARVAASGQGLEALDRRLPVAVEARPHEGVGGLVQRLLVHSRRVGLNDAGKQGAEPGELLEVSPGFRVSHQHDRDGI